MKVERITYSESIKDGKLWKTFKATATLTKDDLEEEVKELKDFVKKNVE